jgi:hypothetical protein
MLNDCAYDEPSSAVASASSEPPGCDAPIVIAPLSSIDEPVTAAVPALSFHVTPVALDGDAVAFTFTPDSTGTLNFEGETLTPLTLTCVGARAIRPSAIARQTAWLPAVCCNESTASVPKTAPENAGAAAGDDTGALTGGAGA